MDREHDVRFTDTEIAVIVYLLQQEGDPLKDIGQEGGPSPKQAYEAARTALRKLSTIP